MKKIYLFLLISLCITGIFACNNQEHSSDPATNMQKTIQQEEKTWSEQDLRSMFSNITRTDLEYIDCVLMPDHASNRVGAVLFRNNTHGTSNVAFFDADGYFKQCGTYAQTADEPNFTYLGDGAVTFQLKAEDNTVYNYTLTLSIEGNGVYFKAEDNLYK